MQNAYPVETILKEVSDLVSSIDDAQKVMDEVVRLTTILLNVGNCSLVIIEPDGQTMKIKASHGLSEKVVRKFSQRVGEGITGHVAQSGKPLLITDVTSHHLFRRQNRRRYSTRSLLSVPLIHNKEVIGVLNVNNRSDGAIFTKPDELLLAVLANLTVIAIDKSQMRERLVETERYEAELRVAREIQEHILPRELPLGDHWEISARSEPARTVAGDFFDVFPMPENRTCVVLGDVCGKGVPAALYMARVLGYFRVVSRACTTPHEIMAAANGLLAEEWSERTFVTATLCLFDNDGGKMSFCSAGHPAPFRLRQPLREAAVLEVGHGLPLGVDKHLSYESVELEADPGDTFILYTDGVTEAKGPGGSMFSEQGLEHLLRSFQGSADELADSILSAVSAFAAEEPQSDDLTLVILRRT